MSQSCLGTKQFGIIAEANERGRAGAHMFHEEPLRLRKSQTPYYTVFLYDSPVTAQSYCFEFVCRRTMLPTVPVCQGLP
jgi:hypothetical protein